MKSIPSFDLPCFCAIHTVSFLFKIAFPLQTLIISSFKTKNSSLDNNFDVINVSTNFKDTVDGPHYSVDDIFAGFSVDSKKPIKSIYFKVVFEPTSLLILYHFFVLSH